MIPNYNLEKCHRENAMFDSIKPVTFIPSIRAMKFRLWDEKEGRLIRFQTIQEYLLRNRGSRPIHNISYFYTRDSTLIT